jgi:hypothetical protein
MSSIGPFREVQAYRLAFLVPSSRLAEHGTWGPGVTVSIMLATFPSTRWRRCLCHAGVIALVALASAHWQCCLQHIVLAELASLPALHWHSCLHCAGVGTVVVLVVTTLHWCPCLCTGATARIALAALPLCWRHLVALASSQVQCCNTLLSQSWCLAGAALASLHATRWCHPRHRLVPPSELHWCLCPYFADVIPLGVPVSVQLQRHLRYVIVHCIVVKFVPLRQW